MVDVATPVAGLGAACSDGGYINKQSARMEESFSVPTTDCDSIHRCDDR